MRKTVLALSLALGVSGANAQPLGLGTSPQGTLTYALGASVAKVLSEKGSIQSRVQPSSGTGTMIPLVDSGEIDIGFANTLELWDAFHGKGTFDKRPNPNLRTLAVIFPIKVGLFVRADSPIKSIKDMKGKTVSYGYTSQEIIKLTVDAMLATEGLTAADLRTVMVPNLVRGVDELMSGRVDISTFAIGSAKVSEADASLGGIRFIPLPNTPEALAAMQKMFRTAYLAKVEPAPNLAGVKEPMYLMGYDDANRTCQPRRAGANHALIAEQRTLSARDQPLFKQMDTQRLFNESVRVHDGAVADFREEGHQGSQVNAPAKPERTLITPRVFLHALAEHGVDYFFANRHRLPADRRGLWPRAHQQREAAAPHIGAAREPRGRDGAWRLRDDRAAAGRDGPRQCRHRQHHQQSDQPVARPRAADPRGRTHADHREGQLRLALAPDPLGPGNVRPGRHGARDRQVGLRAAHAGPDRRRGGARA